MEIGGSLARRHLRLGLQGQAFAYIPALAKLWQAVKLNSVGGGPWA